MTLLQLCQRLQLEVGMTTSPMASAIGQTGEAARFVAWIQSAWMDIQAEHQDWQWMRKPASFVTVAGQASYTLAQIGLTDFGMWAKDTFRNYPTAVGNIGEIFMTPIDYSAWYDSYQYGALRFTQSRPLQFTVMPDKGIGLGPAPAAGYTITADYYSAPSEMPADATIPALPVQFHMAIVYRAMMSYGGVYAAQEAYQRGETEFNKIMRRVAMDRLPQLMLGGPLA